MADCSECWKPNAKVKCPDCGEYIHAKCKAEHIKRHQRIDEDDMLATYEDYSNNQE